MQEMYLLSAFSPVNHLSSPTVLKFQKALPCSFVKFHRILCPRQRLRAELFNVRLASQVIDDGVIVMMVGFALVQDQPLEQRIAKQAAVPAQAYP